MSVTASSSTTSNLFALRARMSRLWAMPPTLALLLGLGGCTPPATTDVAPTPPATVSPAAPEEAKAAPTTSDAPKDKDKETEKEKAKAKDKDKPAETTKASAPSPTPDAPKDKDKSKGKGDEGKGGDDATGGSDNPQADAADGIALIPVKYEVMLKKIAANTKAKYTLMDAWATWCGPCKENFPHVVEMHQKYGGKGIAVISLSMDDPSDPKALKEANAFLKEKKAVFTNWLLDEEPDAAFEKLKLRTIPAVFLFGPDGKELKRYTMDDPDDQFTYEDVEKDVQDLVAGKPLAKKRGKASFSAKPVNPKD